MDKATLGQVKLEFLYSVLRDKLVVNSSALDIHANAALQKVLGEPSNTVMRPKEALDKLRDLISNLRSSIKGLTRRFDGPFDLVFPIPQAGASPGSYSAPLTNHALFEALKGTTGTDYLHVHEPNVSHYSSLFRIRANINSWPGEN